MSSPHHNGTGLVAVHVAEVDPRTAPPVDDAAKTDAYRWERRHERRSPFADPAIDWKGHGLQPRWLDMETSDCAAALDPSIFHGRGEAELRRFLASARGRGEVALVVATIGDVNDEFARSPFGADASVILPGADGSISGRRLPALTRPTLAPGVLGADRDLGLRLLNRVGDAPWWSLTLSGTTAHPPMGPPEHQHPGGRLEAILLDSLGDPVVAVWIPDSGDQRWYAIPDATDSNLVLDWLGSQALAEHVPGALRRVRSPQAVHPSLQTPAEDQASRELAELDANFARDRERLETELRHAVEAAEPVRHGLIYGTGSELVDAVATVLKVAGLTVTDLDELLGDTSSADLLVSIGSNRRLVEVKSAGGNASERLVAALDRHLQTWPAIRPSEPVSGGVLVVNHQHKLDPDERSAEVFSRPEFVATLTVTVLSSRHLFDWWRASNWESIRGAVMGTAAHQATTAAPDEAVPPPRNPQAQQGRRPRWFRRRPR